MLVKYCENVWSKENRQRKDRSYCKHGHERPQQCGGHDVQRRFVFNDHRHDRLGGYIPLYSVLLCVHAFVDVQPSRPHAIQVSSRKLYTTGGRVCVLFQLKRIDLCGVLISETVIVTKAYVIIHQHTLC